MIEVRDLHKSFQVGRSRSEAVRGVSLQAAEGTVLTLLGPSGCGKTTTLRLIAGLERTDAGEVYIDGVQMSGSEKAFVPVNRRPIGMVFQSYAIWPHMTVAANVAFPLRVARPKVPNAQAKQRIAEALALVGLEEYADRSATALSGGQQQRVALARALVRRPKVLLLDEPLSNLDAELRERMRFEIRRIQQELKITTVFVTHDQVEAFALADQIAVMHGGRVVEFGSPQDLYRAPKDAFTARFLGIPNSFSARVAEKAAAGPTVLETVYGRITVEAAPTASPGSTVTAFVRPEGFRILRARAKTTDWEGIVKAAVYRGDSWEYEVELSQHVLRVRSPRQESHFLAGDSVYLQPEPGATITVSRNQTAPSEIPEGTVASEGEASAPLSIAGAAAIQAPTVESGARREG